MKKTGFLVKVRAKNKEYFYLRKAERLKEDKSIKRDKNIYSFGSQEKAMENLLMWKNDITNLPGKLKDLGYELEDVLSWIEQIESK
jgi:hypothetical protein